MSTGPNTKTASASRWHRVVLHIAVVLQCLGLAPHNEGGGSIIRDIKSKPPNKGGVCLHFRLLDFGGGSKLSRGGSLVRCTLTCPSPCSHHNCNCRKGITLISTTHHKTHLFFLAILPSTLPFFCLSTERSPFQQQA